MRVLAFAAVLLMPLGAHAQYVDFGSGVCVPASCTGMEDCLAFPGSVCLSRAGTPGVCVTASAIICCTQDSDCPGFAASRVSGTCTGARCTASLCGNTCNYNAGDPYWAADCDDDLVPNKDDFCPCLAGPWTGARKVMTVVSTAAWTAP